MSSVSRSSRISVKSQIIIDNQDKVIAEQGGQISDMAKEMLAMKRMLIAAGLNLPTPVETEREPADLGLVVDMDQDLDQDPTPLAKKRLLSGSPTGKLWDELDSSVSEDAGEEISEEDMQLSYLKKNGAKDKKAKLSKRARKRARNMHASIEKQKQKLVFVASNNLAKDMSLSCIKH